MALQRQKLVPIIGLNYKDDVVAARQVLQRYGNPYTAVLSDSDGRTAIEFGVYGTPESFLVDKKGVIRYKHTGVIDQKALQDKILPQISELLRE